MRTDDGVERGINRYDDNTRGLRLDCKDMVGNDDVSCSDAPKDTLDTE